MNRIERIRAVVNSGQNIGKDFEAILALAEAVSEIGVRDLGVIAELIRPYGAAQRKGPALARLAAALAPLLEDA